MYSTIDSFFMTIWMHNTLLFVNFGHPQFLILATLDNCVILMCLSVCLTVGMGSGAKSKMLCCQSYGNNALVHTFSCTASIGWQLVNEPISYFHRPFLTSHKALTTQNFLVVYVASVYKTSTMVSDINKGLGYLGLQGHSQGLDASRPRTNIADCSDTE